MSAFDDLTLGEVEQMTRECLGGAKFEDADPIQLAGAVMYFTEKRSDPMLDWESFKANTTMKKIKAFSEVMSLEEKLDPSNGVIANSS